ncbi:MAG: ribosome-associated translation inhibitor RaiA [Akkermansia sp.]|nr:ribosome-associated translation inhibitor RaiA [Akkermansia sp.]MBR1979008.1 ribosome-associated translation inhibitor RaiA [Akkermansia sp.]
MQTSNVETNIIVTGRHIEVTDAIREFATKKIQGIHIDYPRIVEARVVVDVQKDRQMAEIVLFCADHITIQASTVAADLYAAIDETVTKIMRRMRKHKTRLMKHFRPHRSKSIRKLDEKVYEEDVLDFDVDIDAPEDPKPVRISREGYDLKTMYKEDAIMELEISGKPFVLYRNARRNVLQIVYRIRPGEYSIIELGNELKA